MSLNSSSIGPTNNTSKYHLDQINCVISVLPSKSLHCIMTCQSVNVFSQSTWSCTAKLRSRFSNIVFHAIVRILCYHNACGYATLTSDVRMNLQNIIMTINSHVLGPQLPTYFTVVGRLPITSVEATFRSNFQIPTELKVT